MSLGGFLSSMTMLDTLKLNITIKAYIITSPAIILFDPTVVFGIWILLIELGL